MYLKNCIRTFFTVLFFAIGFSLHAQNAVQIKQNTDEHIFHSGEVEFIEDPGGNLTIEQVSSPGYSKKYLVPKDYYGINYHVKSVYWYRIKVNLQNPEKGIFEFFDQTIDDIVAYLPDGKGKFLMQKEGAKFDFSKRLYQHKNFEFPANVALQGEHLYYFRVKSSQNANIIIVYRTIARFIQYALTEYLTFGFFYGMILIFSFHNLLMFIAVRRRQYLFYVLYILSVGLYEMSVDGIAFQYLWPNYPSWNEYAFGVPLYALSVFGLIFTKELLHVKTKAPHFNVAIKVIIALRTAFFLLCLFYNQAFFYYKFIEFVPLSAAFFTGIYIWYRGFRPARFFVLGYAFLFNGFIIKVLFILGYTRFVPGALGHYSLGFSFILEMVFLSFAIGDQVRILKHKKEKAQQKIMQQMALNVALKDSINKELEIQVERRTKEVVLKSSEVFEKSAIIEAQNEELHSKNILLEKQSEEISRMNVLLEKDNVNLKTNIETVTNARVMSTELSFEEFSLKYPDQESCYKFLSDLKWRSGYKCIKCGNEIYCGGRIAYSRRCTKCSYEESVLFNTIFKNNRIPINKAFYLVYLMYTSKGTISSHKLSEKLDIRQSTCWSYSIRVKKVMFERKKEWKGAGKSGWSSLILEQQNPSHA
ncbi:7TM diverse intracellular signaling domain-containing protein [Mucilaginibacter paludis]|uniref:Diverse 7TM receptor transmembrane region n=1 Tax=Mucilaginibacter paludis DSM 18603 TaxID=714943 RepID=H1YFM4_9SPHI|nr:7TM diverse intracellular signaling domain-containing protein [Mucilaginibacter paludis]EHQ24426.1 Diverse 7TM receptor transmembrane region [Mucilaginibacter paludis DSM 18603]